jgi:hypothetical protein
MSDATIFNVKNINQFQDYSLYGGAQFKSDAEAQLGKGRHQVSTRTSYAFRKKSDAYVYEATSQALKLEFSKDQDALHVSHLVVGDGRYPVKPLHYSVRDDRRIFSVLLQFTGHDAGNGLIALYFTKNSLSINKISLSSEYNYLLGRGKGARWDEKTLRVDMCGNMSANDKDLITKGLKAWAPSMDTVGVKLEIGERKKFAPFSDVNTRCVQMIDEYFFEDDPKHAVYGIAVTAIDEDTSTILASSIMMSAGGLAKAELFGDKKRDPLLSYSVAHELGHMLGLDHEFRTNADGSPKVSSIMSYEFERYEDPTPRKHDQDAWVALMRAQYSGQSSAQDSSAKTPMPAYTPPVSVSAEDRFVYQGLSIMAKKNSATQMLMPYYSTKYGCMSAATCTDYNAPGSGGTSDTCLYGGSKLASCPRDGIILGCAVQEAGLNSTIQVTWYYQSFGSVTAAEADCRPRL